MCGDRTTWWWKDEDDRNCLIGWLPSEAYWRPQGKSRTPIRRRKVDGFQLSNYAKHKQIKNNGAGRAV